MSYKVKTDVFEGPFDLLVYLIERAGVSVYEVNISEITDQYMGYVNGLKKLEPEAAADFMVLAATLLQIKSRMLLPGAEKEIKPDDEDDPRTELARLLEEYKKYRWGAELIARRMEEGARYFTKPQEDISEYTGDPIELISVDMDKFISSFALFLEKKEREADVRRRYEQVHRERMSMEVKAEHITMMLRDGKRMSLMELAGDDPDRFDMVLTFVTILEMSRNGRVSVVQDSIFGEIQVELLEEAQADAE